MASMGGGHLDHAPLVLQIKAGRYVNKTLQLICASEGLKQSGVKADLQNRIIARITQYATTGDIERFNRLKQIILQPPTAAPASGWNYYGPSASSSLSPAASTAALNLNNSLSSSKVNGAHSMGGGGSMSANTYVPLGLPRIEFKPSPFYTIEEQLNEPMRCDVMAQHRHTVKVHLGAKQQSLSRVEKDPSLKVMVFCAADGQGWQDITFPHQSEVKVNGDEVKANLRGLKNKPGSTRPVDITKALHKNSSYTNNYVEMTYALTNKKFFLVVYLVRAIPVADLVKKLENGKRITEEAVINTMVNKSRDADIVTTASVLSLKCPLSTLRIDLPCRSVACKHNQCFDATSYLQLQEQGPTWLCPICNNPALFENLVVDEYVKNILKKTPKSTDQVTIQPDGKWDLNSKKEVLSASRLNGRVSESDDDIVEITKSGGSVKMSTPRPYGTPNGQLSQPRDQQTSSAPSRDSSMSNKRPRPQVIDLTSSGDEDDEPLAPPPAPKRQQTSYGHGNPSSVPAYRPLPPRT